MYSPTTDIAHTSPKRPLARLRQWIARGYENSRAAEHRRREAEHLAALPDYLLFDMGLTRDGTPSLARQLRPEAEADRA